MVIDGGGGRGQHNDNNGSRFHLSEYCYDNTLDPLNQSMYSNKSSHLFRDWSYKVHYAH